MAAAYRNDTQLLAAGKGRRHLITATLQDAILGVMDTVPRRDWTVQQIVGAVARTRVVTANDQKAWGGQSNLDHRVRSELAKLKRAGTVTHVRWATYRLP